MAEKSFLDQSFAELSRYLDQNNAGKGVYYARFEFAKYKKEIPENMDFDTAFNGKFHNFLSKGSEFVKRFSEDELVQEYKPILQFHVLQQRKLKGFDDGQSLQKDAAEFCSTHKLGISGEGLIQIFKEREGLDQPLELNPDGSLKQDRTPFEGLAPELKSALRMKRASLEDDGLGPAGIEPKTITVAWGEPNITPKFLQAAPDKVASVEPDSRPAPQTPVQGMIV